MDGCVCVCVCVFVCVCQSTGHNALMLAAINGHKGTANKLLELDFDVDGYDKVCRRPLTSARCACVDHS